MKLNLLKTTLLAVAGMALVLGSAKAQITVSNGDLILGVEATGGTGASTNYLVDLGSFTTFTPTATLNLSSVLSSDLSGTFGSGYASRTDLYWGVVGAAVSAGSGAFKATVFATQVGNPGALSASNLSETKADVQTVYTNLSSDTPTTTNGNAALVPTSNGGSFTAVEVNSPNFHTPNPLEVTFGSGSTINLYQLDPQDDTKGHAGNPGTTTLLGTFSYSGGALSFTGASATPEPSAYALMILGGGLLFWQLKRRNVQA